MNEFDLIATVFKPLSMGYSGSLGLTDDAAIITTPYGSELVATMDAICAGVHYIGDEDAGLIAQKLLRVNLSDLAAMGAVPLTYLLSVQLPKNTQAQWLQSFADGLHRDQIQFGIYLAGGDTSSTLGPASFSVTALGHVGTGKALRRSSAKAGDIIYVTGTLGDSAMGLGLLQKRITISLPSDQETWLKDRYFLPQPRLSFGQGLVDTAHAAMDISDGVLQDLGHICTASNVGATIHRNKLPLSNAASALIRADARLWDDVLSGGDDYELLFTVPPQYQRQIESLSKATGIAATAIGVITEDKVLNVEDENGQLLSIPRKGFAHF